MSAWGSVWGNRARYQEISQNSINLRKADMRKLQVLQNSTLRILLRKNYDTPTSILLAESKTFRVNQTVALSIPNQVWKIKNSCQPGYHYDERLFGRLINENQGTRSISSEDPRINFNLSQGRGSFFYFASNLWNSLPPGIRFSSSNSRFKASVKPWIMSNIEMKV